MKKIFLLALLSVFALTISAQSERPDARTFYRPDYERIQSIGKPAYEKLLKRFYTADTTLTLEEVQNIYFGSAFYGYISGDFDEKHVHEMLVNNEEPQDIAKVLDKYLKSSPVDIRALMYRATVSALENNEEARAKYATMFIRLCDAIIQTGDGGSDRTALHVVDVADEYTLMLYVLDVQPEGQVLTSTKCDRIDVSTKTGAKLQLYFDVQLVLALERRAFSKDKGPFHFTYEEQTGESVPVAGLNIGSKENEIEVIEIDDTVDESEVPQTPLMDEEGNYLTPDIMPQFPGGRRDSLFTFLSANVKYPKECANAHISGKVVVQFVVDTDGTITDVVVVRSSGEPLLDKEAMRVVKIMPKWTPGKHEGKPVRVRYTIPINFKLD